MISQLFILSSRGDIIVNRDFRGDLIKETPEIFYRQIKSQRAFKNPVFNFEGITYIHLHKGTLYLVATTRFNVSPSFVIDYLNQIVSVIQDYCGVFQEQSIRNNFILIYELIDEMMDFGYPQLTNTEQLTDYVVTPPEMTKKFDLFDTSKIFKSNTIKVSATKESIVNADKQNAVFVDVIEKLNVLVNSSNKIITQNVEGKIIMKSYLTGHPCLDMEFSQTNFIKDYLFHESVEDENFENKKIRIQPQKGTTVLMNYRTDKNFDLPFQLIPFIKEETPYKIELNLQLKCDLPLKQDIKSVSINFNLPQCTSSVHPEIDQKVQNQKIIVKESENYVEWNLQKLQGQDEKNLVIKISLSEQISIYQFRKEIGQIKMSFNITTQNVSDMKIQKLEITGTDKENPDKWVRYLTESDSFVVRI